MKATSFGVSFAEFLFPYPPTVNHCWGASGKARFLTAKYKNFLSDAALVVAGTRLRPADGYFVELTVTPPDRRKRDLDNVFKPVLDALTRCCVWQDDSLVASIAARRTEPSRLDAGVRVVVGVCDEDRARRIQVAIDEDRARRNQAALDELQRLISESANAEEFAQAVVDIIRRERGETKC